MRILPVLDLPYGGISRFVIFQLDQKRRLAAEGTGQKYDIRKTAACRKLPGDLSVRDKCFFPGRVICKVSQVDQQGQNVVPGPEAKFPSNGFIIL